MHYSLKAVVAVFCAASIQATSSAQGLCDDTTVSNVFSIPSLTGNVSFQQQRNDAYALFRAQRFHQSAQKYEELARLTTATASDRYWLGEALYHQNQFNAAAAQFSQSIAIDPKLDAIKVRLVEAYIAARKNEQAATACHDALSSVTDPFARRQLEALNKVVGKKGPLFPSLSMKETVETPNNSKRHP